MAIHRHEIGVVESGIGQKCSIAVIFPFVDSPQTRWYGTQ
jgi:hypothetical protein